MRSCWATPRVAGYLLVPRCSCYPRGPAGRQAVSFSRVRLAVAPYSEPMAGLPVGQEYFVPPVPTYGWLTGRRAPSAHLSTRLLSFLTPSVASPSSVSLRPHHLPGSSRNWIIILRSLPSLDPFFRPSPRPTTCGCGLLRSLLIPYTLTAPRNPLCRAAPPPAGPARFYFWDFPLPPDGIPGALVSASGPSPTLVPVHSRSEQGLFFSTLTIFILSFLPIVETHVAIVDPPAAISSCFARQPRPRVTTTQRSERSGCPSSTSHSFVLHLTSVPAS